MELVIPFPELNVRKQSHRENPFISRDLATVTKLVSGDEMEIAHAGKAWWQKPTWDVAFKTSCNYRWYLQLVNTKCMVHDNRQTIKGKIMIKAIRKLLGEIPQADLAYRLGVSVTTVSRWETGTSEPTLNFEQIQALESILEGLGFRFKDLPKIASEFEDN